METLPGYTENDIFSIIPNTLLKFATMPGSSWPSALSKRTGKIVQEELRIIGDVTLSSPMICSQTDEAEGDPELLTLLSLIYRYVPSHPGICPCWGSIPGPCACSASPCNNELHPQPLNIDWLLNPGTNLCLIISQAAFPLVSNLSSHLSGTWWQPLG